MTGQLEAARRTAARRHTVRGLYAGERFLRSIPRRAILAGHFDKGSWVQDALREDASHE